MLLGNPASATCNGSIPLTKPDSIYTNHGNGTVTDKESGLMWMQCSVGQSGSGCATGSATTMNWKQALEAAQTANSGAGTFGYTDWRLPNHKELVTLIEKACYSPAINTTIFPATGGYYWSASPYTYSGVYAWVVVSIDGFSYTDLKSYSYYARLVRGGQ
jgi:hypothetical protein